MTMVVPTSAYDVVDNHHHYSAADVTGGELESIRRRFPHHHQSTSSSSPVSSLPYCNNKPQSDRGFDEMADDLPRPDNDLNQPGSSSIDPNANRVVDESWLRLRLGSDDQSSSSTPETRRCLVELDLLPGSTATNSHQQQAIRDTRPPGFFQSPEFRAPPQSAAWQRIPAPEINWALMRPSNMMAGQGGNNNYYMTNPASMSLMPMGPNFFTRPNYCTAQMGHNGGDMGVSSSSGGGGGMRIIRPPRRPNVGVWFMLQAAQDQVRETFLPQIPKRYLRIKNGRMTVRLLMKYLVLKLGLESESEVEIRCRGQELQPILTLQHVRDRIWCARDVPLTLLTDSPSSSTTLPSGVAADSHIMILHYARPISTIVAATTTADTSAAQIF